MASLTTVMLVWGHALDVWPSQEEAHDFLFRPHPMIKDKRPIDVVIQNEFGGEMIIDILGKPETRQCCVTAQTLDRTLS